MRGAVPPPGTDLVVGTVCIAVTTECVRLKTDLPGYVEIGLPPMTQRSSSHKKSLANHPSTDGPLTDRPTFSATTRVPRARRPSVRSGRLGVPAYFGPWERDHWEALLAAQPSTIVVNPASGPGERRVEGYRDVVTRARHQSAAVLGYVALGFGDRSVSSCQEDMHTYQRFYGVQDFFFDEVPVEGHTRPPSLLRELYTTSIGVNREIGASAKLPIDNKRADERHRPGLCVFNPGRAIPVGWFRSLPHAEFVTFEGSAQQHIRRFGDGPLELDGPAHRQWHLVHGCPRPQQPRFHTRLQAAGIGVSYLTRDALPNPWDVFETPIRASSPSRGTSPVSSAKK
jgi:Spherulation-specific family 4